MTDLQEILRNPPTKEVNCSQCNGSGLKEEGKVEPCPNCADRPKAYPQSSGKNIVTDYQKLERKVRAAIEME